MQISRRIKLALAALVVATSVITIYIYLKSRSLSSQYVYTPRQTEQQAWAAFNSSLEQYKGIHRRGVENMYDSGHVRTLTWTCSLKKCSGIGDQLFRIEFAFLMAVMSDRVFVIHWDEGLRKRTKHIHHNQINWDVFDSSLGMCSTDGGGQCRSRVYAKKSIFGFGWTEGEYNLFGNALFGPEQHITIVGNFYVNSMFIGDNSMMRAGMLMEDGFEKLGVKAILAKDRYNQLLYYRKSPYYSAFEQLGLTGLLGILPMNNGRVQATDAWMQLNHVIFHYLFTFPNDLLTQVERMKTTLQLNSQPYLAVHLRTGFVGSPHVESVKARQWQYKNWKLFDESVWPCVLNHSINLANHLIGPNAPIYIATDSTVAKEWAKKNYGSRIRSSTLVPTHFAEGDKNADDTSSWVDLLMLGGSQAMVHGDSSYATNAAFLRPVPIAMQSWILEDSERDCMVSHVGSNVACIC